MRNTYELHQQTTTTKYQIPDLGQGQTIAACLNVFNRTTPSPLSETIMFENWQHPISHQLHTLFSIEWRLHISLTVISSLHINYSNRITRKNY